MINLMINSIVQVVLFSFIPFVWWLCRGRKHSTFIHWLGLKKLEVKDKVKFGLLFIVTIVALLIPSYFIVPIFVEQTEMATSQFLGQGVSAVIPAIIYSFIQTGLAEEILFRGFLTKRLVNKLGFNKGNFIQGFVFGLIHGCLFFSICGIVGASIITIITGMAGYLMGVINEKLSNGSILSSWMLHACANMIASFIAMFTIL